MGNCGSGEQVKPSNNSLDNSPQNHKEQNQTVPSASAKTTTTVTTGTSSSKNEPTSSTTATTSASAPVQVSSTATPAKQQQQHQDELPPREDSITRPEMADAHRPSAACEEERRRKEEEEEEQRKIAAVAAAEEQQRKKKEEEEAAAAVARQKHIEEEEAERKRQEEEENKRKKAAEDEKYKKDMLEAAILAYKNDIATAQVWRPDGPSDLRDRSIHRACLNNPSLVQINDLFGKKDPIRFREMMFKMRIKKGLIGRQGFHPVLGVIVGNFFFYFPPSANDGSANADAVQCLGSMYLKGVKISEMENSDNKRRILLQSAVPRKKVDGKSKNGADQQGGGPDSTLQLGFDDELQRSRFEECVEEVAIPRPSKEVADALKARGQSLFIGSIGGGEVIAQAEDDDD